MEQPLERSVHLDNFKQFARSLRTMVEDLSIEQHCLKMFLLESRELHRGPVEGCFRVAEEGY